MPSEFVKIPDACNVCSAIAFLRTRECGQNLQASLGLSPRS